MEEFNQKKENLKNALCYIPFVAFFFYFVENDKSEDFAKHIKYWMLLFWLYFVWSIIVNFLHLFWLNSLLFLAYLVISWILWYKVYNGEKVEVEVLDDLWEKIQEKVWTKNEKNNKEL